MTTVIIQPTGYGPIGIEVTRDAYHSQQRLEGDKRGIKLSIWPRKDGGWVAELVYDTSWPTERQFTRYFHAADLDVLGAMLRDAAKTVLPPGAGYPAMPQFETRQAKLAGMLEVAVLTALSEVLSMAAELDASGGAS